MDWTTRNRSHIWLRLIAAPTLTAGLLATAGCSSSTDHASNKAPTHTVARPSAQQVLDWMTNAYAGATSYADSGEMRLRFVMSNQEKVDERVDFSVTYAQPNKLRAHCYQTVLVADGAKLRATLNELPGQVLTV